MWKDKPNEETRPEKTRALEKKLVQELWPLLVAVKQKVDRRLVSTLLGLVMAILIHRHRQHGLLLSELGRYLLEPEFGCCYTSALELESGVGMLRLRLIAYALLFLFSGSLIPALPLFFMRFGMLYVCRTLAPQTLLHCFFYET